MRKALPSRPPHPSTAPLRGRLQGRLAGLPSLLRGTLATTTVAVLAVTTLSTSAPSTNADGGDTGGVTDTSVVPVAARTTNPATPGDFTGYGFDQCLAPTQSAMDAWLQHSPFLAVGIYISGDSRACRSQPNLTPAWISTQLRKGWRLLPITLGPQASCQPRFPRYSDDFRISAAPGKGGKYPTARSMGRNEAVSTVADAKALGIVPGSTLWYDLEGFDSGNTHCRESALSFLSAWTVKLHELGYVSGVYSSAGSGIAVLDAARINRPGAFTLPDRIWTARWDGVANTSTSYMREDGWRPGGRVKQYRGGHDEVWGGVRINIDSNYLDMGRGSVAPPAKPVCRGVTVGFRSYQPLAPRSGSTVSPPGQVKAAQCLLKEKGLYAGKLDGVYDAGVIKAAKAWQVKTGYQASNRWFRRDWISLLTFGMRPVQKTGSAGYYTRRIQRGMNAALDTSIKATGSFDGPTSQAVRAYQRQVGLPVSGVVNTATWGKLMKGVR